MDITRDPIHSDGWLADNYTVHSYEVDLTGRVTLPNLCRFMQEAAWKHAERLGVGFSFLIREKLLWVLAQQRIRIFQYSRMGATITIRTWPAGHDRRFYYRDFRLLDGDREIGCATTAWSVIDLTTRRRSTRELDFKISNPVTERVFSDKTPPLLALTATDWSNRLRVRYGDLDVNNHVNNVKYIEWILEGFERQFHQSNDLGEITVNYLAEALYQDEIRLDHQSTAAGRYRHRLSNAVGGRELCRAETAWNGKT
ncbi:MAG: acyl-ACP thioesterase domain-containing protein [Candidatus Neomarinimicrobiota bacterium]